MKIKKVQAGRVPGSERGPVAGESGGKPHALQTLRDCGRVGRFVCIGLEVRRAALTWTTTSPGRGHANCLSG
jgi:hypothetical protein